MLSPWLNTTVKIQRRPAVPTRNVLNEPSYGTEASFPVTYATLNCRIEYGDKKMIFTETGERVTLNEAQVLMYVEDGIIIKPEDRVTVLTNADPSTVGAYYIVMAVYPEWDSMGNVHHFVCEIQVH